MATQNETAPLPPGVRPPVLPRGFKAKPVSTRKLVAHGPFQLAGRDLLRMRLGHGTNGPGTDDDDLGDDEPPCSKPADCAGRPTGDGVTLPGTPPPRLLVDIPMPATDPQIAAGVNFLVSTAYNRIEFFDKSGALLTKDANGYPLPQPFSTLSFFAKLTPDINAHLNLPPSLLVANGWGITNYYDARTIYDPTGSGSGSWRWPATTRHSGSPCRSCRARGAFNGPTPGPQPPPVPPNGLNSSPLRIENVSNFVMKASVRAGKLYATLQDCKLWPGTTTCLTSIRLVRATIGAATPEVDRTFGQRNNADPAAVVAAAYATPAPEVNKDGDVVVVYNRTGANLDPEARYSIYRAGAADISPSAMLHVGTGPIGNGCAQAPCTTAGNLDVGGISVGGADDSSFWVAHGYGNGTGSWTLALGKIPGRAATGN